MRWLHLSDIHFGYQNASVSTMRKKLLTKVQELGPIDCLFITGDLRYGKKSPKTYPADTLKFIQDLQAALKLSPENTFIVPGNHDINRSDILPSILNDESKRYSTPDGTIRADTLDYISAQRAPFLELYENICGRKEPGWHYCIPYGDFNIICLNTAILCGCDGEDGSLIVGSELLNHLAESVDSSKPGIVLAHHDFDSLRQEEQQKLEIALKEMGAVLYLCGHKHVALHKRQNTHRHYQDLFVFLCGTNMDHSPGLSQTDMDFFVGQTDDGHSGYVQAFKWYPRPNQWEPDIEFSMAQNGVANGIVYFPEQHGPKPLPDIHPDVLAQYQQFIRQQCGEIDLSGLPVTEEDVKRRYALRELFIPLNFREYASTTSNTQDIDVDLHDFSPADSSVIPEQGIFRMFILSDPGGGKSTLLKWITSVYCFPDEYKDIDTHLPKRDLFPVWLRCRDIPVGSRPSIWKTIQDMALRGEWLPHGSNTADFTALIAKYIVEGKMLLLIDGLDEIGSETDRDLFVDQLRTFADYYPTANIIISSRPTGFPFVTKRKFEDFRLVEIAPLKPEDIKALCIKWNLLVSGGTLEAYSDAESLADLITGTERILRLARNPLLLTTLLLVKRRVGRLPTKRVDLYEEAIRVLLDTWNRRGHEHQPIDLDEARYQLAYVAYHMMTRHTKRSRKTATITRSKLLTLLRKARQELSDMVSNTERPADFVNNIERRSSLLIQKGFEQTKNGEREQVYEFQHLTFQEYLAAYAVNHNCYPGAKEGDDLLDVIAPHLSNPNMREVIPLVAGRSGRYFPNKLADLILEKLQEPKISFDNWIQLRDILLQCIADEVPLPSDKTDQVLAYCFSDYFFSGDEEIILHILNGRNADKLRARFQQMDMQQNPGFEYHACALAVIAGDIEDPYEYYKTHCDHLSSRDTANAISVLAHAYDNHTIKKYAPISKEQTEQFKTDLYSRHLLAADPVIQLAALLALVDCEFVESSTDWVQYFSALSNYINANEQFPDVVPISLFPISTIQFERSSTLTAAGFQRLLNQIDKRTSENIFTYSEQLTLALFGIAFCSEDQDFVPILENLQRVRKKHLRADPSDNNYLYFLDTNFHRAMHQLFIQDETNEVHKNVIRHYLLKTDHAWATQMSTATPLYLDYVDYSSANKETFPLSEHLDNGYTIEQYSSRIIAHIESRMKELGIQ